VQFQRRRETQLLNPRSGDLTVFHPSDSTVGRRRVAVLLVVGMLLLGACTQGTGANPAVPPSESSDGGPAAEPQEPSEQDLANLYADAAERGCIACRTGTVYVLDHFSGTFSTGGVMPKPVAEAIGDVFTDVRFVSPTERDELLDESFAAPAGTAIVTVGPLTELGTGVVGIDVSTTTDSWFVHTMVYRWDGSRWAPSTAEETGVTVTSAVS
jgi:hypothetical protein